MAVPSPSPDPRKSALRAAALLRRRDFARSLSDELRGALEAELARLALPHLAGVGAIGAYHPLSDEIGPGAILSGLGDGQRVGLPWFADREARFIWREGPAMEPGPWGIAQPAANAAPLLPQIVLVPLVLADRHGTRIGHGKGHYDRALAHLRAGGQTVVTIGLAWECQIAESALPADAWDVPLDAIATPSEYIRCA